MAIRNILNWTDPVPSGITFASGFVFLVSLSYFSLLSVISHFALAAFFVCLGSKIYVHLMGALKKPCKDPLEQLEKLDTSISSESVEKLLSSLVEYSNEAALQLKNLCLLRNYLDSAKFAGLLYLLTFIGGIFNTLTLVTLGWVLLFILPTVYEQNQKAVDEALEKVKAQYEAVNAKIVALLPAQAAAAAAAVEKKE